MVGGMSIPPIPVQLLTDTAQPPQRAHDGDAGADLIADEDVVIAPGERALVGTGIAVAVPYFYVGLVHPRSGLAHKHGVTVLNAPGTIDYGYTGEVKVNLFNAGAETFTVTRGMRIAQLVVQRVELPGFAVVDELTDTERGSAGHGSTGV